MAVVDLEGAYDLHIHAAPCLFERIGDDIEIAQMCRDAGYRAIMLKAHHESTASRAYYADKSVPDIKVFGGLVLNSFVGGINPAAAEAALKTGAKEIWMPTVDGTAHRQFFGVTGNYGVPGSATYIQSTTLKVSQEPAGLLKDGSLPTEVLQVLELVRDYDGILGTTHICKEEMLALAADAVDLGVKKILITHPHFKMLRLSNADTKHLVDMGAILELCSGTVQPIPGYVGINEIVETIRLVGAQNCIISSDTGSPRKPVPPETTRAYLYCLKVRGIAEDEIRMMTRDKPQALVGY